MNTQIPSNQYIRLLENDIILNRYRVLNEIGYGELGAVYRCLDTSNSVLVALKVLRTDIAHHETLMDYILSCSKKLFLLHHPNIASVFSLECDNTTGDYFVVSELVEGCTLSEWLASRHLKNSPPTLDEIFILARNIANALDYAHSRNIFHGHLSPANIRLNPDGVVKVLDFSLTIEHLVSRTPNQCSFYSYGSPEVLQGEAFCSASDQYSLATIIYELFTEELPFDTRNFSEFLDSVAHEPPSAIDGIPGYTNYALLKSMSKEATSRFPTCISFVDTLEGIAVPEKLENDDSESRSLIARNNPTAKAVQNPVARQRSLKPVFLVSAASLFLLLSVGLYFFYQSFQADQKSETTRKEKILGLMSSAETALDAENLDGIPSKIEELQNLKASLESASLQTKYDSKTDEIEVRKSYASVSLARDKIFKLSLSQEFSSQLEALELLWKEGEAARQGRAWRAALNSYASFIASTESLLNQINLSADLKYASLLKNAEESLLSKNYLAVSDFAKKMLALKPGDKRANEYELLAEFEVLADEGNRTKDHSISYPVAVKLLSVMPNYPRALGVIGVCYAHGHGVPKDVVQAAKWYRKAADQGNAAAQFNLGVSYHNGEGVEKDVAQAISWYSKAADQGDVKAQFNLGAIYFNGLGVPKDVVQAAKWYRKAADQGDVKAQFGLGTRYYNGEGVEKNVVQAAKWYRKAADQGYALSQFNLACCYYTGTGVDKDFYQAATWFRKAADQGDVKAQFFLGDSYYRGEGVTRDVVQAISWYRKAADQGCDNSLTMLGVCYYIGSGVPIDVSQAVNLWQTASSKGNEKAKAYLADHFKQVRLESDRQQVLNEQKQEQARQQALEQQRIDAQNQVLAQQEARQRELERKAQLKAYSKSETRRLNEGNQERMRMNSLEWEVQRLKGKLNNQ